MIFGQVLRTTRERNPGKTALIVGGKQWTYAELDDLTDRVAGGLLPPVYGPTIAWPWSCRIAPS